MGQRRRTMRVMMRSFHSDGAEKSFGVFGWKQFSVLVIDGGRWRRRRRRMRMLLMISPIVARGLSVVVMAIERGG